MLFEDRANKLDAFSFGSQTQRHSVSAELAPSQVIYRAEPKAGRSILSRPRRPNFVMADPRSQ